MNEEAIIEKPKIQEELLNNCNYTLCPEPDCYKVPFIKIIESNLPDKLKIECECQRDKQTNLIKPIYMKITDYLKKQKDSEQQPNCFVCGNKATSFCLNDKEWYCETDKEERIEDFNQDNFTSKKVDINIECENEEHQEYTISSYCKEFQKHLCEECLHEHNNLSHSKEINIEELKRDFKFEEYLQNFKNEKYLSINEQLKDEMISRLEKQIELIKQAFEKNKEINENLKLLIKNILFTYKDIYGEKEVINNYQIISNVMYNCRFNEPKLKLHSLETSLENINKLIHYYNTNFIFGNEQIEIENFYNVKTIEPEETIKNAGTLTALSNGNIIFCNKGLHVLSYNESDTKETFYTIQNENKKLLITTALCEINNKHLVTGTSNGNIFIWKMNMDNSNKITLQQIYETDNEIDEIIQITKISNGSFAAISHANLYVYSFALEENGDFIINENSSKKQPLIFQDKDGLAFTALIKPKNLVDTLISGSNEGAIKLWNIETKECVKEKKISCNNNNAFIEVDNNLICIGSGTNVVLLDYMNWKESKEMKEIVIHNEGIVQEIGMIIPTRVSNVFLLSGIENIVHLLELNKNGGNIIINQNKNKDFNNRNTIISIVNWGKRCALIADQEGSVIMWNY